MRLSARNIDSKSTSPWPGRDEVPAAARLARSQVAAEDRRAPVERRLESLTWRGRSGRELGDERGRVQELVLEVARIEVDAEARRSPIASSALRVVTKS
jgi:hypothetical protein